MSSSSGQRRALFFALLVALSPSYGLTQLDKSNNESVNRIHIRCSSVVMVHDLNDDQVVACLQNEHGCRPSCTGLSRVDEAINPSLAAADLIIEQVPHSGAHVRTKPLYLSYHQKLSLWRSYRAQIESKEGLSLSQSEWLNLTSTHSHSKE